MRLSVQAKGVPNTESHRHEKQSRPESSLPTIIAQVASADEDQKVIANIDVMRTGEARGSSTSHPRICLAETPHPFEDTLRFRVEPMFDYIARHGLVTNVDDALNYLHVQIDYTDRRLQEEQGRAQAMRDAFNAYLQTPSADRSRETSRGTASGAASRETVVPQLGENFIDQIVRMVTESQDTQYRQKTSREIAHWVSSRVLPLQAEATYYRQLMSEMRGLRTATPSSRGAAEQVFLATYEGALRDVQKSWNRQARSPSALGEPESRERRLSLACAVEYRVLVGFRFAARSVWNPCFLPYGSRRDRRCLLHNRLREEGTGRIAIQ